MLKRLKSLLGPATQPAPTGIPDGVDPERFALAGLLAEVAMADGDTDDAEQQLAVNLLVRQFAMTPAEASDLFAAALDKCRRGNALFRFTNMAKKYWPPEERTALIEMLWEVVYADARQDDFEAGLMRRLGGLLHIPDRERGAARKRVLARRQKELSTAATPATTGEDDA